MTNKEAIADQESKTDTWSIKDVADTLAKHGLIVEQEPCGDAISRQKVLDVINLNWEYRRNCIRAIEKLPPVNPQEPSSSENPNKWIPVSERLPEDGQNVLFCDIDNDIMVGYHVKGRPDTHFSQDGTYENMKDVRAWMPLPKPYEPKESEG